MCLDICWIMKERGFSCKQCGKCCLTTGHVDISKEDIESWKKIGRHDLFTSEMLMEWDSFGSSGLFRNQLSCRCPFLRKKRNGTIYYCKIHKIKPVFCKSFPKDRKHAKKFCGCVGYG